MIHILLASYKGEAFIGDQVQSILNQSSLLSPLRILISDDESAAQCATHLEQTIGLPSQISIIDGTKAGVNANFLHLIHSIKPLDKNDLFGYSDQDDVWLPNKISAATLTFKPSEKFNPRLYAGRTQVVDEDLKPLFLSKGMPRTGSFKNALLESIAGGNTMIFDIKTLKLLQKVQHPVHHDWLTYMVVTACHGDVFFDDQPYVLYRQHGANVIGANNGIFAKLYRLKKLIGNEFKEWATNNIIALTPLKTEMSIENRHVFEGFVMLHEMNGWQFCLKRLRLFNRLGLYRQRRLEHFGFMCAAFLGKI